MASRMANAARRIMHSVGFKRKTSIPFGAYWEDDIWGLTQGRTAMTIVDVGANIGQTAHKLVQRFPDATVYSFEPVPTTFAELKANTADLSDVHCIHCALGDFVGQAQITTHRGGRNSVFSVAGAAAESTTAIHVNTLDAFCAENRLDHIDVLKIDTEGFEPSVLRGAGQLFSDDRIDFVVAECDFFRRANQPHGDFLEIHELLAGHGFHVVGFYNGGVDGRGWIWGDVLMMREGCVDLHRIRTRPLADEIYVS